MNGLKEKLNNFHNLCRKKGLKVTPQRTAVYKILIESREHPSVEMVYEQLRRTLPNVSLDTVNRTLNTLSDIGAAFIVEGCGDVRRFDGNLNEHRHFICVKCKKIFDFTHKTFDNITVPEDSLGEFKVLRAVIYLEGLCKSCQENK